MRNRVKRFLDSRLFIFLISLFVLLSVALPLFRPYALGTADGLAHKFRLVSFMKAISEGYIKPRWLSDQALGFGSPIFLFNYSLPYYIITGIKLLPVSINTSVQIYQALTLVASFIFMYLFINKLWGRLAGLVAATVYTLAPYHLLTIYLYEGWGEFSAFMFPPLILYLIVRLLRRGYSFSSKSQILIRQLAEKNPNRLRISNQILRFIPILHRDSLRMTLEHSSFLFLIITWFLFILTHNVSVVMFTPVLLLFGFYFCKWKFRPFLVILNTFVLAALLSAFFWLPAILLNNQTHYPNLIAKEMGLRNIYYKSLSTLLTNAFLTIQKGSTWYFDFTIGLPIVLVVLILLLAFVVRTISSSVFRKSKFSKLIHFISLLAQRNEAKKGQPGAGFLAFLTSGIREETSKIRQLTDLVSSPLPLGEKSYENSARANHFIIILLVLFFLSIYLSNSTSDWAWRMINSLKYIVYPFRFLFLATFAGSILAGIISRKNTVLAILLIVLSIIAARPFTKPTNEIFPFDDAYFHQAQTIVYAPRTLKNMATTEFLPKWVKESFLNSIEQQYFATRKITEKFEVNKDSIQLSDIKSDSEKISATYDSSKDEEINVNTFYFPNWKAKVDREEVPVKKDSDGRIIVQVPKGKHNLLLYFSKTPIEKAADLISWIAVGVIVILVSFLRKQESIHPN